MAEEYARFPGQFNPTARPDSPQPPPRTTAIPTHPDTRPTSRRRFLDDPGGGFRGTDSQDRRRRPAADLHDHLGDPSVPPAHDAQPRPPGRHAPSGAGVAPALGSWRRRWPAPPPPPPSPIRLLPAGRPTTRPLPADGIVADATSPVARAAPPRCAQPRRLPVAGDPAAVPPILRTRSRDPPPLFSSSPQTPHLPPSASPAPKLAGDDFSPVAVHRWGEDPQRGGGRLHSRSNSYAAPTGSRERPENSAGEPSLPAPIRTAAPTQTTAPQGRDGPCRRAGADTVRQAAWPVRVPMRPPRATGRQPRHKRPCACACAPVFCQIRRCRLTLAP